MEFDDHPFDDTRIHKLVKLPDSVAAVKYAAIVGQIWSFITEDGKVYRVNSDASLKVKLKPVWRPFKFEELKLGTACFDKNNYQWIIVSKEIHHTDGFMITLERSLRKKKVSPIDLFEKYHDALDNKLGIKE